MASRIVQLNRLTGARQRPIFTIFATSCWCHGTPWCHHGASCAFVDCHRPRAFCCCTNSGWWVQWWVKCTGVWDILHARTIPANHKQGLKRCKNCTIEITARLTKKCPKLFTFIYLYLIWMGIHQKLMLGHEQVLTTWLARVHLLLLNSGLQCPAILSARILFAIICNLVCWDINCKT